MEQRLQLKSTKIVMALILAFCGTSIVNAQNTPSTDSNVKKPALTATPKKEEKVVPYQGTTFDKIKSSGKVLVGFRGAAAPISYFDENKKPIGYGIDICSMITDKLKQKLNMPNLVVEYVETSTSNRIPLVVSGKADFECGTTSTSAERRKQVAFSVPYYMDAVRILVKSSSSIKELEDLRNQTVAFSKGTIAVPIMHNFDKQRFLGIKFDEAENYAKAIDEVDKGRAVALVSNSLLLEGVRVGLAHPENYKIVGDFLSVEATSIMLRKDDPEFQNFMNTELIRIAKSGQLEKSYKKWFLSPIPPKNQNLNIKPSLLLMDIFRMPTPIVGN